MSRAVSRSTILPSSCSDAKDSWTADTSCWKGREGRGGGGKGGEGREGRGGKEGEREGREGRERAIK